MARTCLSDGRLLLIAGAIRNRRVVKFVLTPPGAKCRSKAIMSLFDNSFTLVGLRSTARIRCNENKQTSKNYRVGGTGKDGQLGSDQARFALFGFLAAVGAFLQASVWTNPRRLASRTKVPEGRRSHFPRLLHPGSRQASRLRQPLPLLPYVQGDFRCSTTDISCSQAILATAPAVSAP
jgi:hypothetical protein